MRIGTKSIISVFLVFFVAWAAARVLLPLFSPFLLGGLLALAAEPMVAFLRRKTRLPGALCTGLGVTMAMALVTLGILLLCGLLVRELGALAGVLPDLGEAARAGTAALEGKLLELVTHTPQSIQPILQKNVAALFSGGAALVDQILRYLLGLAGNLLSHVPDSALGLGTGIISAYLISAKLPKLRHWLLRRLPREKLRAMAAAGRRVKGAVAGWLMAQCKLMLATFAIVAVGLIWLRVPYGPLWALGIALVDALPVLGTGAVLLPWAAICLIQDNLPRALGLLGVYLTVTLVRSMLEPRLVGRHMGLDPLAALAALYAGYQLWGIGGMILAPLLTVLAIQLVNKPERRS